MIIVGEFEFPVSQTSLETEVTPSYKTEVKVPGISCMTSDSLLWQENV